MLKRKHVLAVALTAAVTSAGFDTSRHNVPLDQIVAGGPPKDGIPAITKPHLVAADAVTFLQPGDRVVGVERNQVAKAYPLRILNWHEAVNDTIGGTPIVITYCPLTASALVFQRTVGERTLSFGISGRLYQSNVLFYDHQSESLWSQLKGEAVTGPETGSRLHVLPTVVTTWADWRRRHPQTEVLSQETGYSRNYARDPYAGYHASPEVMFPLAHVDTRLQPKEKVLGVQVGSVSKAYPLARLAASKAVHDDVGGTRLRIEYDSQADRAEAVHLKSGAPWPAVVVYWFAWSAFHPETAVWHETVPGGAR